MWNAFVAGMLLRLMANELKQKEWIDAALYAGLAALNLWVVLR